MLDRFFGRRSDKPFSSQEIAITSLGRADAARDARKYSRAASLYEAALRTDPANSAIHMQCGHMYKEAGDLPNAERHYREAERLAPEDPDVPLQLGHFHKVCGDLKAAERYYRKSIELDRDWSEPAIQLAALYEVGWRNHATRNGRLNASSNATSLNGVKLPGELDIASDGHGLPQINGGLVPELTPSRPQDLLHSHSETIEVRRFGRRERSYWGMMQVFRGIEAIRGFCISRVPIVELRIALNGLVFHTCKLEGFPLKYEASSTKLRKYVFNVWCDFGDFDIGRRAIELRFVDANGGMRVRREDILIGRPFLEEDYPNSDTLVCLPSKDGRSLEEQINSRPSMVRPARRALFATPPKSILVQRADQLGDLVCSVAAIRRLRELFPHACIVGLLSPTNEGLARSLRLFDEIIVIDFNDDKWERRRVMPLEMQRELREKFATFKFDMAIDLSESDVSRPLLLLSGAPFIYGFWQSEFLWQSAGFTGGARDPINHLEQIPHTNKMLGLIEWLGLIARDCAVVERRSDIDRSALAPYGLSEHDRYIVLHTGARLEFSRWPYYFELAQLILERTDLKVVMMADDPTERAKLPPSLTQSERFQIIDKRLAFDDFDALLSFCAAFVGNDSGPKHLASLRGAKVVSIHMARNNWNEWGQENEGLIISRRVPCAGCSIHHFSEECGKDFACVKNISTEEVFGAVKSLL